MSEQRLNGEWAIVTGSDSGIGQATAIAFAREGANVVVTYLHDRQGAEQTAREVEIAGRKAAVFRFDQRESKNVAQLFLAVNKSIGVPNILVNNAGIEAIGALMLFQGQGA